MHQTTPFNKEEEAIEEFKKIFKQKSGNEWENKEDFVGVPKKYKLLKVNYNQVDRKEYLIPFKEFPEGTYPVSKLSKEVEDFMSVITT